MSWKESSHTYGAPGARALMSWLIFAHAASRPGPNGIGRAASMAALIDGARRLGWLNSALAVLNAREMDILKARRLADESATLETLGASLGISKERVRQIENRALEKLRTALLSAHPDRYTFL